LKKLYLTVHSCSFHRNYIKDVRLVVLATKKFAKESDKKCNSFAVSVSRSHTTLYLHEKVKQNIIDKIYSSSHLPYTYNGWRTTIIDINGLDRRWAEQKKVLTAQYSHKPTPPTSFPKTTTEKHTGTGVMYTGQGQKMDVDQAKAKGLCFQCGKPGHLARNCSNKPKFQVHTLMAELTKEEKKELAKTLREEGFSGTQQ
jgi:hypothetical protein